jgi:NADP-dependent 3-hydroxy acid dehydrogenase YdfG
MQKVVFITGASSGIGKAIGEFLHYKDFIVYGTSRNPSKVENSIFPLVALDVRDVNSIKKAIAEVLSFTNRRNKE